MPEPEAGIRSVRARPYTIPTEGPEGDGTFDWTSTTIVVIRVEAGGLTGLGYSYTDASAAALINGTLADCVVDRNALDVSACWLAMRRRLRNIGVASLAATALSAVDTATLGSERQAG